jgi:hypothetical protein
MTPANLLGVSFYGEGGEAPIMADKSINGQQKGD